MECRLAIVKASIMSTSVAPTVRDKELIQFELVESANINSFTDFVPSNLNETESNEDNDFINIFICHLIFYCLFCISLVFHILIDLGLGSFIKNKFVQLISIVKNTDVDKNPAFA